MKSIDGKYEMHSCPFLQTMNLICNIIVRKSMLSLHAACVNGLKNFIKNCSFCLSYFVQKQTERRLKKIPLPACVYSDHRGELFCSRTNKRNKQTFHINVTTEWNFCNLTKLFRCAFFIRSWLFNNQPWALTCQVRKGQHQRKKGAKGHRWGWTGSTNQKTGDGGGHKPDNTTKAKPSHHQCK